MDMKKMVTTAGKWAGFFVAIIIAMYFLYPLIHPEEIVDTQEEEEWDTARVEFNPGSYSPEAADSLNSQIDLLQQTIDSLRTKERNYLSEIDSLEFLASQLEQESEEAAIQNTDEIVSSEHLKDISRSLLELDEEELRPILDRLNNNQLTGLYKSSNNMQRSKLLRSLGPDKAAVILKEIM